MSSSLWMQCSASDLLDISYSLFLFALPPPLELGDSSFPMSMSTNGLEIFRSLAMALLGTDL